MSAQRDGGPAFPGKTSPLAADVKRVRDDLGIGMYDAKELLSHGGGMSLRDWFAGRAMGGLVAYPGRVGEVNEPEHFARWSYAIADAMLAAREVRS